MSEVATTETSQPQTSQPSLQGLLEETSKKTEAAAEEQAEASKPKENHEKTETLDPKFASKFAALSQRERKLQDMQSKLKEQMKALENEKKELEGIKTSKLKARENPLEWLKAGGLEYDDLVKYMLNGEKIPAESMVKQTDERVKSLEEKIAAYEAEKERARQEQAITGFKNDIKAKIDASEEYELIRAFDSYETVYNVIEQHFEDTGRMLSIEEAAELVENHLTEQAEDGVKKVSATKKLASKLGFLKEAPNKSDTPPKSAQPAKTLTNSLAQESIAPASRQLTREEEIAEAAKLLRFTEE